jgi:hypothetical protein
MTIFNKGLCLMGWTPPDGIDVTGSVSPNAPAGN